LESRNCDVYVPCAASTRTAIATTAPIPSTNHTRAFGTPSRRLASITSSRNAGRNTRYCAFVSAPSTISTALTEYQTAGDVLGRGSANQSRPSPAARITHFSCRLENANRSSVHGKAIAAAP
jgi:hypothetical protein